jgi:hypothetical protein
MRFMMLVKSKENAGPPPRELMEAMAELAKEAITTGAMLHTGGLAPTAMSTRVRLSEGQVRTIDGPFAETKEVVGGFAIFNLNSKEEAVQSTVHFMELHRKFWPGWEGETEIRQIFGPEDIASEPTEATIAKTCGARQT